MTVFFRVMIDGDLIRSAAVPFRYPGGELHLKEITDIRDESAVFVADIRFGYDFDKAIDGDRDLTLAHMFASVAHQRQRPFVLMCPYLPAARSDRSEPVGADPVGAAVYAERINAMNPQQVIGVDPHSHIVERHIRNLTSLDCYELLDRALGDADYERYDAVIAPDKGAVGRAQGVADMLGLDLYTAEKHRDFDTGKITGIKMSEKLIPGNYLVVDDICDGGGTFLGLADATGIPKDQLGLWVTHGIFSGEANKLLKLREKFGRIYTTDSHPGARRIADGVAVADVIVPCEEFMWQNMQKKFTTGSTEGFA